MSMRDAGIMDGDLLAVQSSKDARTVRSSWPALGDEVTVKRFRRNKNLVELHRKTRLPKPSLSSRVSRSKSRVWQSG